MRKELLRLRERMQAERIDAWLIMTDDFHGSEYVGDYFKCREYISGFTGSAGTLLVLKDHVGLWTDGRYFLQAKEQLEGSGITLYRSGQPGVPSLENVLQERLSAGETLGFDGRCVMAGYARRLREQLEEKGITVVSGFDLVGDVWEDRPPLSREPVWILPEEYAGMGAGEKIAEVRRVLKQKKSRLVSSCQSGGYLLAVKCAGK